MMEQMDLFAARESKPLKYVRSSQTSLEAAIAAEPRAGTQRRRVLDLLREYPATGLADHEMQGLLGMNPSTQRPRRIELVEAGLVKDSGNHRLTDSGKRAVVWVAA
jgi:hypothetical protein